MGSCSNKCTHQSSFTTMQQMIISPQNKQGITLPAIVIEQNNEVQQNIANTYDRELQQFVRELFPHIYNEIFDYTYFMEYLKKLYQSQNNNQQSSFQKQLKYLIKCLLINKCPFEVEQGLQWNEIQRILTVKNNIVPLINHLNPKNQELELNPTTNAQTPINQSRLNQTLQQFVNKIFPSCYEVIQNQDTFMVLLEQLYTEFNTGQFLIFLQKLEDLIQQLKESDQAFVSITQEQWNIVRSLTQEDPNILYLLDQVLQEFETEIIDIEKSRQRVDFSSQTLDLFITKLFLVDINMIHAMPSLESYLQELNNLMNQGQYVRFIKKFKSLLDSICIDRNLFATNQQMEWTELSTLIQGQPTHFEYLMKAYSDYKQQIIDEQLLSIQN